MRSIFNFTNGTESLFNTPLTCLGDSRIQVSSEQSPRILQILLCMGLGGGNAFKGFVEEGDDALLFGEWGNGKHNSTGKLNV